VLIRDVDYRAGDRVFYRNRFGQQFNVPILEVHTIGDQRLLLVDYSDYGDKTPHFVDVDTFIMSRHFPAER
jgi:hypothetical protein